MEDFSENNVILVVDDVQVAKIILEKNWLEPLYPRAGRAAIF